MAVTLKVPMYSESRKTARHSLAHHRARLLFSPRRKSDGDVVARGTPSEHSSRRAIVRNGLIGYVPEPAT